jgi:hypothetical protein
MPLPGSEAPRLPSFDEVFGDKSKAIPGGPGPGGPNDPKKSFLDDIIDTLTGEKAKEEARKERLDRLTGKAHDKEWKEKEAAKENASEFRPMFAP